MAVCEVNTEKSGSLSVEPFCGPFEPVLMEQIIYTTGPDYRKLDDQHYWQRFLLERAVRSRGSHIERDIDIDEFCDPSLTFPLDANGNPQRFLICEGVRGKPYKSVKLFIALAIGIPVVTPPWIFALGYPNRAVNYRHYLVRLVNCKGNNFCYPNNIVPHHERVLAGKRVFLIPDDVDPTSFKRDWTAIICAAGGEVVEAVDETVFCAVGELYPLDEEYDLVRQFNIPITSYEWVVQSILCREVMAPDTVEMRRKFYSEELERL